MASRGLLLHDLLVLLGPDAACPESLQLVREALLAGAFEQALAGVAEDLRQRPSDPQALVLGADAFNAYGQSLQALELIQRARAGIPSLEGLQLVEAQQLSLLGRHEEALLLLEPLLQRDTVLADARAMALVRQHLSRVFLALQRPEQALETLQPLLDGGVSPETPSDLAELAAELMLTLQRPVDALPWAEQAHRDLDTPASARRLAGCHFLLDAQESYGQVLRQSVETWPQDGELAALAALALFDLPDPVEGWALLQSAAQHAGTSAALRFVEARQHLIRGDFARGWSAYEARLELPENNLYAPCPPGWRDQSPRGRTVVVVAEQGVGDVLFFSRFLVPLQHDASRVVLVVEPRLMPLLQRSYPAVVVLDQVELARGLAGPDALWIPLGSLPLHYGCDRTAISSGGTQIQLQTSPRLREHWRLRLQAEAAPGARIGISLTAGGAQQDYQSRKRSVDPQLVLTPLQDQPVTLIDLQHRGRLEPEQTGAAGSPPVLRFEEITRDLDQLCALITQLDLLITSDQTNAFLGGMLGIRTLVIAPPNPHFMLMDQGERSPWFDSIRIVRAARWRDWQSVAEAYGAQLAQSLAERSSRGSGMYASS